MSVVLPLPFGPSRPMRILHEVCTAHGLLSTPEACFAYLNDFPEKYEQIRLF